MTEVTPAPEVLYDPYAKIVVNTHQPVYSGVTPHIIEAHEVTSLFNNRELQAKNISKYRTQIENVRDYLVENYDDLDDHAVAIAKLLGIELSTELEVVFDVSITATLAVPVGTTVYDLSTFDFDVSLSSNDSDYDVEDYNADINDINIRQVYGQVGNVLGIT